MANSFRILTLTTKKEEKKNAAAPKTQLANPSTAQPEKSMLPKLSLPRFTGKYSEWTPFKDLFSSMIANKSSLTKIEKFQYLKSCFEGEVAQLLRNVKFDVKS